MKEITKMCRHKVASVIFGWIIGQLAVFAQPGWVPLSAKHKVQSFRVHASGSETLVNEISGMYYRSSSGSTLLVKSPVVDGQIRSDYASATMTDAKTGEVFNLDYKRRVATLMQRRPTPLTTQRRNPSTLIGSEVVNGIACVIQKVECVDGLLSKDAVECGKAWYSQELDLLIRMETTWPGGRDTMERYDIQIGEEPAPSLFEVPADFERVARTEQLACPQCPWR